MQVVSQRQQKRISLIPWGTRSMGQSTSSFVPWVCPTFPLQYPLLGMGKGQASCWRKGPLGLCWCHAGHISSIPPLAPAPISKDFPAFLITPFSAPVFQEARGFFQCPDSPDSLAKLLSAGISLFPDSGGVKC